MTAIVAAVVYATASFMAGRDAVAHRTGVTPAWAISDWARLVQELSERMQGEGTILINPPGKHIAAERHAATKRFIADLAVSGWNTTAEGANFGWFTCLKQGAPNVTFGVLPWQSPERSESLFAHTDTPSDIAHKLAAYHAATGGRWCGAGGTSGNARIRSLERKSPPMWHWTRAGEEPAVGCSFEMSSTREPTPQESRLPWVHHYDVRSMYLAAAGTAELGWDIPTPQGAIDFDRTRPGYWRVLARGLPVNPHGLLYRNPDANGAVWLTTERLNYLVRSWGVVPEVLDATVSSRTSRALRHWSEIMASALTIAPPYVVPSIKDTYTRTIGLMRRTRSGRIRRPDWRDTIVDTAGVNLLRKLDRHDMNPLRVRTDSVWVASDQKTAPDLDSGQVGGLRYEDTMTMADYLKTHGKAPR